MESLQVENSFVDIRLFNRAVAENRQLPPVNGYLRSTGLSDSEITEVESLFKVFCAAIENAPRTALPDLASGSGMKNHLGNTSLN
jgi:hypothetical protein